MQHQTRAHLPVTIQLPCQFGIVKRIADKLLKPKDGSFNAAQKTGIFLHCRLNFRQAFMALSIAQLAH